MDLTVEIIEGFSLPIRVNPTDTIRSIKTAIHQTVAVTEENQRLFFNDIELINSRTVAQCGIHDKDVLHFKAVRDFIELTVRTNVGLDITVHAKPGDCVSMLKDNIALQIGVPPPQQHISEVVVYPIIKIIE